MAEIEFIFRYTTWYSKLEQNIIPIYLGLFVVVTISWERIINMNNYSLFYCLKNTNCYRFKFIFLVISTFLSTAILWILSITVVEFKKTIKTVVISAFILNLLSFLLTMVKINHLSVTLTKSIPRYFSFKNIQRLIFFVAWIYILFVFIDSEPLTKPVPFDVVPSKLCHSKFPDIPFNETFLKYVQFHKEMLKKPIKDQRVLVFHSSDEGLGNKLEGFVSSFVMAFLTDRV